MTAKLQEIGRLAMRQEGNFWVAYYAMTDTMENAVEIGRIHMGVVADNPERKEAFQAIVRDFVGDFFREHLGEAPSWKAPVQAPEHERSGTA